MMLFLWSLSVILSTICTVYGRALDQKCIDDNCSCCVDRKCGSSHGFENACLYGCIDGHRGPRCYELCQYPNCKSCGGNTPSTVCTNCYDGYYLGQNKDCTSQCPSNCKSCTSSTRCTVCKEGFYDKNGSTTCKYAHCPVNCVCNGQGDCVSCKKGYYDTSTSCTKQCPVNCLTCVSAKSCYECKNGFYNGYKYDYNINLLLNNCTYPCKDTCTQCQSYNGCLQCIKGKYGSTCQEDCSVGCKDTTCLFDTGQCTCTVDFTGDKCMKCVDGKYGLFCNETCSKYCNNEICERTSHCANYSCSRNTGNCVYGCKKGYSGDKCCVMSENCFECQTKTECKTCVSGYFKSLCNETCPVGCHASCHISTGECILNKEAHQQIDEPNTVPVAVLGSLFTVSFAANILVLIVIFKRKLKVYRRKHSRTQCEPTYENQLGSIEEQSTRIEPTDTSRPVTEEKNVYEGISKVNETEHEYQQVSYDHDDHGTSSSKYKGKESRGQIKAEKQPYRL